MEIHIKGLKMRKKQSITPYYAKQISPRGRRPTT
jgi:hypothetical protein